MELALLVLQYVATETDLIPLALAIGVLVTKSA